MNAITAENISIKINIEFGGDDFYNEWIEKVQLIYFLNKDIIGGRDAFWDSKNSVEFSTDQVDENFPIVVEIDSGITMVVESSDNHYSIQLLLWVLGHEAAQFGKSYTSEWMNGGFNLSASNVLRAWGSDNKIRGSGVQVPRTKAGHSETTRSQRRETIIYL